MALEHTEPDAGRTGAKPSGEMLLFEKRGDKNGFTNIRYVWGKAIVKRRKSYTDNKKLMNIGLWTGKRKRLRFIILIMMEMENHNIICGKQLQSKTKKN